VVLLSLRVRPRILDTLDRFDTLCLGILIVVPWSGRDPLARGRYSFAGGRLKSSIVYFGSDLVPFGRRIVYSQNRTVGLVERLGTDSGGRGPST